MNTHKSSHTVYQISIIHSTKIRAKKPRLLSLLVSYAHFSSFVFSFLFPGLPSSFFSAVGFGFLPAIRIPPVFAPLRSAQSRCPPDIVRPRINGNIKGPPKRSFYSYPKFKNRFSVDNFCFLHQIELFSNLSTVFSF